MNEAGILLKFRVARYMKLVAGELEVAIQPFLLAPCCWQRFRGSNICDS